MKNNKYLSLFKSMLFIECHYHTEITTDILSVIANLQVNDYTRSFKSLFGVTPNQFITHCRLRNACYHIIGSNRSFTDIAALCGFKNLSHLRRSFKKIYNMTLTDFRFQI